MTKPDCRACGACCWSVQDQPSFCDLTPHELKKMSPQFLAANVELIPLIDQLTRGYPQGALRTKWRLMKSGPFKGIEACVCCLLDGSLMKSVRCRIYAKRPSTCRRAVKPGDRSCRALRRLLQQAIEAT